MNSFVEIIFSKDTLIMVLICVLAGFLSLKIEDISETKNTLYPLVGIIPSIAIWYFYFVKKTTKK